MCVFVFSWPLGLTGSELCFFFQATFQHMNPSKDQNCRYNGKLRQVSHDGSMGVGVIYLQKNIKIIAKYTM